MDTNEFLIESNKKEVKNVFGFQVFMFLCALS